MGISRECMGLFAAPEWWRMVAESMKVTVGDQSYLQTDMDGGSRYQLFEYDMSNMYYNVDQRAAIRAVEAFVGIARGVFRRRVVAVNKANPAEDRMGSGSGNLYWNLTFTELLNFVQFQMKINNRARVGYIGFRQTVGVPMGGECSGQLTQIYFFMKDFELRLISQALTKGFSYYRYRDNLPGIYDTTQTNLQEIKHFLEAGYGLPLKLEDAGHTLVTLELSLKLVDNNLNFLLKPHMADLEKKIVSTIPPRVPAWWSTNRIFFLKTVIPGLVQKSVVYGSSQAYIQLGILNAIVSLVHGGFTLSELRFRMIYCARKFKFRELETWMIGWNKQVLDSIKWALKSSVCIV